MIQDGKVININKDKNIVKPEKIVLAKYKLSSLATKIINILVSEINENCCEEDKEFSFILEIKEIAKKMGISYKGFYDDVKKAIDELLTSMVYIEDSNGWIKSNWISSAQYKKGDGTLKIKVSSTLVPYFIKIKEKFLVSKLEYIFVLKGSYTIRIYEILKNYFEMKKRYINEESFNNKEIEVVIELKWLREILMIPKSYLYGTIKRNILMKSIEEINKKTDIYVDFEEADKKKKKVESIKFTIRENKHLSKKIDVIRKMFNNKNIYFAIALKEGKRYVIEMRNGKFILFDLGKFETLDITENEEKKIEQHFNACFKDEEELLRFYKNVQDVAVALLRDRDWYKENREKIEIEL